MVPLGAVSRGGRTMDRVEQLRWTRQTMEGVKAFMDWFSGQVELAEWWAFRDRIKAAGDHPAQMTSLGDEVRQYLDAYINRHEEKSGARLNEGQRGFIANALMYEMIDRAVAPKKPTSVKMNWRNWLIIRLMALVAGRPPEK